MLLDLCNTTTAASRGATCSVVSANHNWRKLIIKSKTKLWLCSTHRVWVEDYTTIVWRSFFDKLLWLVLLWIKINIGAQLNNSHFNKPIFSELFKWRFFYFIILLEPQVFHCRLSSSFASLPFYSPFGNIYRNPCKWTISVLSSRDDRDRLKGNCTWSIAVK